MRSLFVRLALLAVLIVVDWTQASDILPSPAALALRREYNGVASRIDTLVRLYSAQRFKRLADPSVTPGVALVGDQRIVLLIWADDEARVFLNGAPVGQTRLTPTRIEIPKIYLQADNELVAQCRDTDRVESGFMAGLYVEDDTGLRPIRTTADGQGWEVATGEQTGSAAQEIFYAHTQPDIPGAQVMWGPQLFGNVDLRVHFSTADVSHAARSQPLAASLPKVEDKRMEFHESLTRLVGLQQRRRELATLLTAGADRMDPYLRSRGTAASPGLGYTLGKSAPLSEATDLAIEQALEQWTRHLPATQQKLVLHDARALRDAVATTPASPLPEGTNGAAADRNADYQPPQERGTAGTTNGTGTSKRGSATGSHVALVPSAAFLWRMGAMALGLFAWTSVQGWRGWRLWHAVDWGQEV